VASRELTTGFGGGRGSRGGSSSSGACAAAGGVDAQGDTNRAGSPLYRIVFWRKSTISRRRRWLERNGIKYVDLAPCSTERKYTVLTGTTLSFSYWPAWTFYIALQQRRRRSTHDPRRNRLCRSTVRGSASFSNLFGLRLRRRLWRLCSGCRPRRRGRVRVRLRRRIGIPVRDVAGGFFSVHLTSSECFSSVADPFCVRMPLASSSTTARAITATTSTDLIRTVRDLAALWQLLRSARQDQPPARRRST
jgi:hypothetical protein